MFNRSLFTILAAILAFSLIGCLTGDNDGRSSCEVTLSIIKPDAVSGGHIGEIISRFEKNGLRIAGMKMMQLNEKQAQDFYAEHKDRPFYSDLIEFMTSGPVIVIALAGHDVIKKNRELMGATDPKDAVEGTIRIDFGTSIGRNAVHGSDSPEAAVAELNFFFKPEELRALTNEV